MPEISLSLVWIPVAAYLLGSIPFGMLLAKMFGGGRRARKPAAATLARRTWRASPDRFPESSRWCWTE